MIALYIVLIILAILMIILLIPVRIFLRLNVDDGEVTIKYAFLKIKLYPREVMEKSEEEPDENKSDNDEPKKKPDKAMYFDFLKAIFDDFKAIASKLGRYTLRHAVRIRELNVSGVFGLGDPMYTGMLCGVIYPLIYNAIGVLDRNMRLDKWDVNLNPDFNNMKLSAGIYAEIRTRAAHFIAMLLISLGSLIRITRKYFSIKKSHRKDD